MLSAWVLRGGPKTRTVWDCYMLPNTIGVVDLGKGCRSWGHDGSCIPLGCSNTVFYLWTVLIEQRVGQTTRRFG